MTRTHTVAELELSPAAYDEIERKLLEAGYEHLFEHGPGSAIDLSGIAVTREPITLHNAQARIDQLKITRQQIATELATPYIAPDHDPA